MPVISTLKFIGQMLTGIRIAPCEHLEEVRITDPTTDECAACAAASEDWVHLRMCLVCGYVGCCDSSRLKHMTGHVEQTGHPIARSIERRESWVWCYPHERLVRRKL